MNLSYLPSSGNSRILIAILIVCLPITAGIAFAFGGILTLAAFAGIIYTVIVFTNPRIGLYSMVLLLPFDSYFLISDSISLTRLVGILAFTAWILRKDSIADIALILKQKLAVGLTLLAGLSMASLLWADYQEQVIIDLLSLVQLLVLFFFVVSLVNSWQRLRTVLLIFLVAVLSSVPIALYQFYIVDRYRGGDGLSGTVNEFAIQIIIAIPILLYYFQTKKTGVLGKIVLILAMILLFLGLAISQSRTSILLLPLVLILQVRLVGWSPSKRFILFAAIFLSLGVAIYYSPRTSLAQRFVKDFDSSGSAFSFISTRGYLWWIALSEFVKHPILGIGFDNFRYHFLHTYQFVYPGATQVWTAGLPVHNTFLSILVQLGVLGGMITIYILWQLFAMLRIIKKRVATNYQRSLLIGTLFNCLIAFLLYSLLATSLFDKILWIMIGLVQAAYFLTLRSARSVPNTIQI